MTTSASNDPVLQLILSGVFPDQTVSKVETVEQGNRKKTQIIRFGSADPVVVQRTSNLAVGRTEAYLLEALRTQTSLPVPRLIASGTNHTVSWFVTELLAGSDLHRVFTTLNVDTQQQIVASLGYYLAELHEKFQFNNHGPLVVDDNCLVTQKSIETPQSNPNTPDRKMATDQSNRSHDQWREWFLEFGKKSIERLPAPFDSIREELLQTITDTTTERTPTPRLFPWDLRPGNALIHNNSITAILDWESPLAADCALSVAKTEYLVADWYVSPDEAPVLRDAFRNGYSSHRELPHVQPGHRLAAIANTAVDSKGSITNPQYPPVDRTTAISFHQDSLTRVLDAC